MKLIVFKPKTKEQAKAALAIAESCGHTKYTKDRSADEFAAIAIRCDNWRNGVIIDPLNRSIFCGRGRDDSFYEVSVPDLDALVDALSEPVKATRRIVNLLCIIDGKQVVGKPVHLEPDGAVRVDCHKFPKESFERIHREWLDYNKAE